MTGEIISDTISSLDDLTNKTISAGIEFKGFTKSITEAASSFEGAGKKWTVFSRLVSGTPIWALQNKLRAYLAIIGGFEKRSKENSKAMKEQNKKFVEQMQGVRKVNAEYAQLNEAMDDFLTSGMDMEKFNKLQEDNEKITLSALENTKEYQLILAATNDERMAAATALEKLSKRKEDLEKQDKRLIQAAKEAYAFDNKRIGVAQRLAEEQAKLEGKTDYKAIGEQAAKDEKTAMTKEQKGLVREAAQENNANIKGRGGLEDLKKSFAPFTKYIPTWKKMKSLADKKSSLRMKMALKAEQRGKKINKVLGMAFKYLIFGILGFIAFGVLAAFLYSAWQQFEAMGVMDTIKEFGAAFMEIITLIVETFVAFTSGGIDEGLEKLQELGWAIAGFVWIGIKLAVKLAGVVILGLYHTVKAFFTKFWNDADFQKNVLLGIAALGAFVLAAWAVKYFLGIALTLAGIYAIPILIGVAVGLAALAGIKWLWDQLSDWDVFADGGTSSGGMAIVGERGPEIVNLPAGAKVHSNKNSRKMAGSGGTNINVTINARDTSDAELRRIADKIGSMLNNSVNRRTSSGSMG